MEVTRCKSILTFLTCHRSYQFTRLQYRDRRLRNSKSKIKNQRVEKVVTTTIMSSSSSSSYAPSAPSLPDQHQQPQPQYSNINNTPSNYHHATGYYGQVSSSSYSFPQGTNPDVIRTFQMFDRDQSGFIDDKELQQALSSAFHYNFNIATIRFLIFLFKDPPQPLTLGPKEFVALWNCLAQWRGIFERYDKDRSGKIDPLELRDALYGIGYAIPGSVLQLLLSKYGDGSGRRVELGFDNFVECGMIIKGLTEKFKEKDTHRTGSAKLSYDDFMSMVIPFLVSYD